MSLPVACNLGAIPEGQRARYQSLLKQLRSALRRQEELPEGFVYRVDTSRVALPEVAEWITLERLCCPFLSFGLEVESGGEPRLRLTGPAEAKAILLEEFPG
jgi:hypothetical protein